MNNLCGLTSFSTEYSSDATLSAHQLTLLSILNGVGVGRTTSDKSMTFTAHVEVLSPRPLMPRQAFQSLLSDSVPLSQTPRSLLNSRALTTPSVEKLAGHVAQFGAIGEGRPTVYQRQPRSNSPEFLLTPDTPYDSVFDGCFYVERPTNYSAHLCYVNSSQMTSMEYITNEVSPSLPSMLSESPQDVLTPITRNASGDVVYEDRRRLYQLIDSVLSPASLRVRTSEEVCHFLLALAENCEFKITIYTVVESLLDHVVQSGYPENYDFVTFCSTLMAEIGIKWPGQKWPTVCQEYMAETLVDLFKDAWATLLPRGPSKYPVLYRACAFYGQLYVKGVLSPTQYLACFDVIRVNLDRCPPRALYYLTSGDMKSFEAMPL